MAFTFSMLCTERSQVTNGTNNNDNNPKREPHPEKNAHFLLVSVGMISPNYKNVIDNTCSGF